MNLQYKSTRHVSVHIEDSEWPALGIHIEDSEWPALGIPNEIVYLISQSALTAQTYIDKCKRETITNVFPFHYHISDYNGLIKEEQNGVPVMRLDTFLRLNKVTKLDRLVIGNADALLVLQSLGEQYTILHGGHLRTPPHFEVSEWCKRHDFTLSQSESGGVDIHRSAQ
jgi:hypothetical protein